MYTGRITALVLQLQPFSVWPLASASGPQALAPSLWPPASGPWPLASSLWPLASDVYWWDYSPGLPALQPSGLCPQPPASGYHPLWGPLALQQQDIIPFGALLFIYPPLPTAPAFLL